MLPLRNTQPHDRLDTTEWEMAFQANGTKKQAGRAILRSEKINFKPKLVRNDKEAHFAPTKGNPSVGYYNPKHICIPNTQFHDRTLSKIKPHTRLPPA